MAEGDEVALLLILSILAFVGFPLILLALSGIGRLLNHLLRRDDGWAPGLVLLAGMIGLLAGGSLYLDAAGVVVPGEVLTKNERVDIETNGEWQHHLTATVRYHPSGHDEARTRDLPVDGPIYDRLRPGSAVRVRYIAELPLLARLAEQSTLSVLPWTVLRSLVILGGGLALVVLLVFGSSRRRLWTLPLVVVWALLLGQAVWESPLGPGPLGPWRQTTAEVVAVERITKGWFSSNRRRFGLAEPYQVANLRFVPAGRDEPVLAAAPADIGSVRGLVAGGSVPVSYPEADPRAARLVGATHTAIMRDWLAAASAPVAIVVIVGGLIMYARAR